MERRAAARSLGPAPLIARRLRTWALALALSSVLTARASHAETPAAGNESAEDRKAAGKAFAEGQRAYTAGDYRHAAESFEKAYSLAPRLPPLWNAARAWHKAGEPAKAANLYARYLRDAPPSAQDRASSIAAMKELEPRLSRIEIHAEGLSGLTLDGAPLDDTRVFVAPGAHVLSAKRDERTATETVRLEAGATVSVVLKLPADEPARPVASAETAPPAPSSPPSSGLPPVVAGVLGGLALVGAGVTTWSGLDTRKQKTTFDAAPTQENLDSGHSKETRTNVLLAVTGGLGVATAVVAIFFTDGKPRGAEVSLGLGSAQVRGSF